MITEDIIQVFAEIERIATERMANMPKKKFWGNNSQGDLEKMAKDLGFIEGLSKASELFLKAITPK